MKRPIKGSRQRRGGLKGINAPKRSSGPIKQDRLRRTHTESVSTGRSHSKGKATKSRAVSQVAEQRKNLIAGAEHFRSLVETAAVPILLLSPEFVVLELNSGAEQLYGWRRTKLIGQDYLQVLVRGGRPTGIGAMLFEE